MRTISLHLDFPGRLLLPVVLFLYLFAYVSADAWTPIVVKNIKLLGTQVSLNLTDVSRDGGHSVLLSNRIVWIYDDTECTSLDGTLLSFLSNTAAYASNLESTALTVEDDGVVTVGKNKKGKIENAILDDEAVKSGGWIPFTKEEADFNNINKGKERIAICTSCGRLQMVNFLPVTDAISQGQALPQPQSTGHMRCCTLR